MVVEDEVVPVGGAVTSGGKSPAPAIITPRATVAVPAVRVGFSMFRLGFPSADRR